MTQCPSPDSRSLSPLLWAPSEPSLQKTLTSEVLPLALYYPYILAPGFAGTLSCVVGLEPDMKPIFAQEGALQDEPHYVQGVAGWGDVRLPVGPLLGRLPYVSAAEGKTVSKLSGPIIAPHKDVSATPGVLKDIWFCFWAIPHGAQGLLQALSFRNYSLQAQGSIRDAED